MNAILENKKVEDNLRGFERPDSERHLNDDISTKIVDGLVKTVSEKFSIAKEFYKLKAQLLKQEKLEYYERNVESGSVDKEYSYEESAAIVEKVLEGLDKKFGDIFKRYLDKGLIDVYPKKGKRGGAFCVYVTKSQPAYVMLNHTGRLDDVATIAHEMGHAINNEMVKENQNALNFGISTATAEVASTFMEDFVFEEMAKEADDETRLSLMITKLNSDISSIIRQVACYNFEKELHEKFRENGFLSKEEIGKVFQKHMSAYMGDFVKMSPGSENWWVYWSHIRTYFYVYSYASGLLISKALQRKVKQDKGFIENVKKILSSGISKSVEDIFKEVGIELNEEFWEHGLKEIEDLLNETKELAKKLGKI